MRVALMIGAALVVSACARGEGPVLVEVVHQPAPLVAVAPSS